MAGQTSKLSRLCSDCHANWSKVLGARARGDRSTVRWNDLSLRVALCLCRPPRAASADIALALLEDLPQYVRIYPRLLFSRSS